MQHINAREAAGGLFITPQHSPLLALPVMLAFGLWVANGMLHLIGMASESLTICYCIDVEMAGGAPPHGRMSLSLSLCRVTVGWAVLVQFGLVVATM